MNEEKIRRFLNPELSEGYTIYRNLTMYRSKHDDTYTYYADPSRYRWSKHFPTLIVSKYGIFYLLYTEETDLDTITKELDDYYIGFIRQLIKSSPFSLEEKMNTIIIKGFIYAYNLKKDTKYDDLRIVTNPEQIEHLIQFNRVPSIPTEYADDAIRKLNIYIQSVFKIKPTRGQIYNIPSVNNPVSQNSKKSASNFIERIVVLLLIISVFFFIGALLNESFSSERDSAQAKQQEQENTDTNETDDSQTNDTGNAEQPSEESDGNTSYDQQVQQMRDEYNQEVQRQNEEYARRVQEGNANYNQQVQQMQEESARQVQQMQEESAQREQQMQEEYQRNAQNMQ